MVDCYLSLQCCCNRSSLYFYLATEKSGFLELASIWIPAFWLLTGFAVFNGQPASRFNRKAWVLGAMEKGTGLGILGFPTVASRCLCRQGRRFLLALEVEEGTFSFRAVMEMQQTKVGRLPTYRNQPQEHKFFLANSWKAWQKTSANPSCTTKQLLETILCSVSFKTCEAVQKVSASD